MPEFSDDWVTWHAKAWTDWLGHLHGKAGVVGLEVGSHEGRSALYWLDGPCSGDESKLICIDPWEWQPEREQRFDVNVVSEKVRKLKGRSEYWLPRMIAAATTADFVYVDGSHHAPNVLNDLCLSWLLLKRGGILVVDDYTWTSRNERFPPRPAIDSWLSVNVTQIKGYEISKCGQVAIWKP